MAKPSFPEPDFWLSILEHLEELPPDQILPEAIGMIKEFRTKSKPSSIEVWDFLKKLLNFVVVNKAASAFVITTIDVEPHYAKPKRSSS